MFGFVKSVTINYTYENFCKYHLSDSSGTLFFSDFKYGILIRYRIVANASPSRFEAHVGLFRLLMKGIFDPYAL